jgi:hypothetical protein
MTKAVVTMLATVMMVSAAFAGDGSIAQSIDSTSKASASVRDSSVSVLYTEIDATQSVLKASQTSVKAVNGSLIQGIKAVRGGLIVSIDSTVGSTDSVVLDLVAKGLKMSVRVPTAFSLGIVKGENMILTRASESTFVLSREVAEGSIQMLELHPSEAVSTYLMALIEASKAALNDVNELE